MLRRGRLALLLLVVGRAPCGALVAPTAGCARRVPRASSAGGAIVRRAEASVVDSCEAPACRVALERRDALPLPRLAFELRPSVVAEGDVRALIELLARVLDRDEDFSAFYDLRDMKMGLRSRAALRLGGDWMALPANAARLDARVKGVAILVRNPVIRGVARWCIAFCDPPAPVELVKSEAEALKLAEAWA